MSKKTLLRYWHLIGNVELCNNDNYNVADCIGELPAGAQERLHRRRRLLVGELKARHREEHLAERYEHVLRHLPENGQ